MSYFGFFCFLSLFFFSKNLSAQLPQSQFANDSILANMVNFKGEKIEPPSNTIFILLDANSCTKCLNESFFSKNKDYAFLCFKGSDIKNLGVSKTLNSKYERPVYFYTFKTIQFEKGSFEYGKDIGPVLMEIKDDSSCFLKD